MTQVRYRLDRLEASRPRPVPRPVPDLSCLTEGQCSRLDQLNERFMDVGMAGLADAEIEEVAALLHIIEEKNHP